MILLIYNDFIDLYMICMNYNNFVSTFEYDNFISAPMALMTPTASAPSAPPPSAVRPLAVMLRFI